MNDISKILKELSNLTSSLDGLSKEIGKTNSLTKETNKDLSSLVKETKSKSSEKKEEKKEEKNPSESILDILNKQKNSFLDNPVFSDIQKMKVKPAETDKKDTGSEKSGQITKDLIKSVIGRLSDIPKLESGGKIKGDGVALVGEKGPELVELKKGDNVNSQDQMSELLKMEMDDMKKSQERRAKAAENPVEDASKMVAQSPKLDEPITNSYGVKVPKSEIDSYRKKISEDFKDDPESLEEEMNNFVEGYRETFSLSDLKKLSEKKSNQEIKSPEEESANTKKDKPESKKTKSSLKKITSKLQKGKDNLKEKAKQIFEKTTLGSTINGVSDAIKNKKAEDTSTSPSSAQSQPEKLSTRSKIEKIGTELKSKFKFKKKETPEKEKSESPMNKEVSTPADKPKEYKEPEKPTGSKSEEKKDQSSDKGKPAEITSQDIADIKSLLASMNSALNGPLNIKNNKPYRPHSNMLE